VGGAQYYASNNQGSYDNSVEAAKSDCLVRCCKALPMFRECWDKDYCDYWKATYAAVVAMPNTKAGKGWKKHGSMMRNFDTRPDRAPESEYTKPPSLIKEQQAHLDAIASEGSLRMFSRDEHNENADDYQTDRDWQEDTIGGQRVLTKSFLDDGKEF
jgi:hypothetical protein